MEIRCYVGQPNEHSLLVLLEALTAVNAEWLRAHPNAPGIYESGVRYEREGSPEQWLDVASTLEQGHEDCDGLSCWRAAELRVSGYDAHPVLRRYTKDDGSTLYHALTEIHTADSWIIDDPSARLGMLGDRPAVAGAVLASGLLSPPSSWSKRLPGGRLVGEVGEARRKPTTVRLLPVYRYGRRWTNTPEGIPDEVRQIALAGAPPALPFRVALEGDLSATLYYFYG